MRDWLSHRVVSSPSAPALVRAEDGETWTYAELDRLVAETAGRLAAHGIEEGDHLGVLMPACVGTVGLVHASMRLGATFVPFGDRLTATELSKRMEATDLTALVCSEATEVDAVAAGGDVPVLSVDEPTVDGVESVHDADPVQIDRPNWDEDDRLCLLFTSGTTGDPKPVELTLGNVQASAVASGFRLGIDPTDRWFVALSLHHMGGLAPVYRSALYGTTVILREGFDPGGVADDIDRYEATGVSMVPTMLQRTLDSRGTLSDSLRVVLLGGAPAPDELIERCRDYSIPVYPTYGMTEAASQIATATPDEAREHLGTVGRPLFGTDITVVDEDGSPVEPGDTGEIVVSGPTITPGYYRDPAANDAAFGPFGLHTGDSGRIDEHGYLHVLNRLDDRIISGGENVEPGEVADVFRRHDDVLDISVIGIPDEVWGERVAALIAVGDRWRDATEGVDVEPEAAEDTGESGVDDDTGESGLDDDTGSEGDEGVNGDDGDEEGSDDSGATDDGTGMQRDASVSETTEIPGSGTEPPIEVIDEDELFEFAREHLAGFKLPRTVAYIDDLPRTVSGTVDREAVREVLDDRGFPPGDPSDRFSDAGFEPVDPKPAEGDVEIPDADAVAATEAKSEGDGDDDPETGRKDASVHDGSDASADDDRNGSAAEDGDGSAAEDGEKPAGDDGYESAAGGGNEPSDDVENGAGNEDERATTDRIEHSSETDPDGDR